MARLISPCSFPILVTQEKHTYHSFHWGCDMTSFEALWVGNSIVSYPLINNGSVLTE
jgi:hypothetical protein